jgi:hypothetical protein
MNQFLYAVEESGCDTQHFPIQYWFELPLAFMALLGFLALAIYMVRKDKFLLPKFNGRSICFLLFWTYHPKYPWNWYMVWGGFIKDMLFLHGFVIYRYFVEWLCSTMMSLPSQSGYGKSKYLKRQKDLKKAREKRKRAEKLKEERKKEDKEKKHNKVEKVLESQSLDSVYRIVKARPEMFKNHLGPDRDEDGEKSQSGFAEFAESAAEFYINTPSWAGDLLAKCWSRFRENWKNFELPNFELPKKCPKPEEFEKFWNLFRESEVFNELYYLLRMMVSLGFLKKININFHGLTLFVTEPLRDTVTVVQFIEKAAAFAKLFLTKLDLVYSGQNVEMFFQSEAKNAYDDEYTFLKSQKPRVDLGREADVEDELFDRRVHECIEKTLSLLETCKQNERAYYSQRLAMLRDMETSRTLSKKDTIRIKPYGLLQYGDSASGKSCIANALNRYVLQVNGFDHSPRAVTSLNMEDKFQSEFASYHKGVIFDDICNTALDHTEGSPVLPVIMFLNNMPMAALNANAEMKGKVMIEPMVVSATTNVKDLMSNQLSNEPLSINRRFEVTITQTVKPVYRKRGTTMLDRKKIKHMSRDQFPEYATYTIEEPRYFDSKTGDKRKSGKSKSIVYDPIVYEGKELVDVDITTMLRFLRDDSREHFAHQRNLVNDQKSFAEMPLCKCSLPVGKCGICPVVEKPLDSQAGFPADYFCPWRSRRPRGAGRSLGSASAIREVTDYFLELERIFIALVNSFLQPLIMSYFGSIIVAYCMRDSLKSLIYSSVGYYIVCVLMTVFCEPVVHIRGAWLVISFTIMYTLYLYIQMRLMRQAFVERIKVPLPSEYFRNLDFSSKKHCTFLSLIGIWKLFVKLTKNRKKLPTEQSASPAPRSAGSIVLKPDAKSWQQEVEHWDTHARERQYMFGDAGISEMSRCISVPRFLGFIGKKLMNVVKDSGEYCNVIPLKSNILLLPNHFVTKVTEFVSLTKIGGHTFKNMPLDDKVTKRIDNTDFAVWWCPGAGVHKNIIEYYPKFIAEGKKVLVQTVYNRKGEIARYDEMTATRSEVATTRGGRFQGYKYSFPEPTFGGLCMATLVGQVHGMPFIAGHHLAGENLDGGAGVLTRQQIYDAIAELEARPGVLVSHSATPLKTRSMGIEFGPLTPPHPKCPTHELPLDAKIRVHGGHNMSTGSTRKSAVVTSVISDAADSIMSIDKKHDKPKQIDARRHKVLDLAGKVDTATRFESEFMQKAFIDFETLLLTLPKTELAKLGKLSDDVILSGWDGVIGINAMNFSTCLGFPDRGPKTKRVKNSDRVVEGISCPRDVDPEILEEVAAMEQELLAGRSINTIFKASLKDEPTKMTKDKVRVFAAANMPFVMLVRKYFLTIAALVQRNPAATECAVGVNVQSPEWTEMFEEIGKHGWDRCIAGDYAKFDGRMSPQFMLAAFKLMIRLAERSGNYGEGDLTIMRGIATEICYPTYDYFGTIVQFMGSNPSGHPLTVIVNSFVNSLYLRYCWYAIAAEKRWWRVPLFWHKVSVKTYGDDNIMTVARGYDDFNHTAVMKQLAKVGITYTMADKEAESVPFIPLQSASFLKHYAVWDDELELYRAPVEEDSIAKMLHTHLESKVLSTKQSSAEAIQNVALKYFEFGKEEYDKRKSQLEDVARVSGVLGHVGPIMSYEERKEWYRKKFDL